MDYVTPNEAEARTGIDATTIRKWAARGEIEGAEYVGERRYGYWKIPVTKLDSLRDLLNTKHGGRPKGSTKRKPRKTRGKSKS